MLAAPLLDFFGFKARALMPAADADQAAGFVWKKSAPDSLAADTMSEQSVAQVNSAGVMQSVVFRPLSSLAHDDVNYATISIFKRSNGGATVLVAQVDTTSLDWVASVPVVIPVVAGDIEAGDIVTCAIAKSGTGVIVPNGTLVAIPSPSFFDLTRDHWQSRIFGYLRKRYVVTAIDTTNPPEVIVGWIARCIVPDMFRKRGMNPSDAQMATLIDDRNEVMLEVKQEASDAATGLIDLPLLSDEKQSGVTQGGPYGYAEPTAYDWTDKQAADAEAFGTFGDDTLAGDGAEIVS